MTNTGWFLQSMGDHDTHRGNYSPATRSVHAKCGIDLQPLKRTTGAPIMLTPQPTGPSPDLPGLPCEVLISASPSWTVFALIAIGWFTLSCLARGHENQKYAENRPRHLAADDAVIHRQLQLEPLRAEAITHRRRRAHLAPTWFVVAMLERRAVAQLTLLNRCLPPTDMEIGAMIAQREQHR
jgi:hypothetical protein